MIRRYSSAVVLGGVVTFGLFFLMQSLIAYGTARGQDEVLGSVIDFVMVTNESETQTKRRRPPRKLKDERPPEPPDIELDRARKPQTQNASHSFGAFDFGDLQGGPHLGGAPTDGDILPLVRIEPRYPARALQREIEGWVLLEFSISPAGTVVNPFVWTPNRGGPSTGPRYAPCRAGSTSQRWRTASPSYAMASRSYSPLSSRIEQEVFSCIRSFPAFSL